MPEEELTLKANQHPPWVTAVGPGPCTLSELHFPDEGDICKIACQHDFT